MKNSLYLLLNNKWIFIAVLISAVFFRISYEFKFNDYNADKAFQVFAAQGIDNGIGCKIKYADLNDLSLSKPSHLYGYNQAYSYIISALTPQISYVKATAIIDALAVLLLIFSGLGILKSLSFLRPILTIYLLLITVYVSPFNILSSTDLIVTSICIFNMYILLSFFQLKDKTHTINALYLSLISIFSFLPFLFKMSAFPFIFQGFLAFVLMTIITKKYIYSFLGLISLTLTAILTYFSFLLLPYYPKEKFLEKGFFPEHLKQMDIFPFKSFWEIENYLTPLIGNRFTMLLMLTFSLILIYLLIKIALRWYKIKSEKNNTLFILLTLLIGITTIGFLTILSLRIPGESWKNPPWTFVEETRYYGPIMILLQLIIIVLSFNENAGKKSRLFFRMILISAFVINGLFFIKQSINLYVIKNNLYTFDWNYHEVLNVCSIINASDLDTELPIVYADYDEFQSPFVAVNSKVNTITILPEESDLKLNYSKPLTLILYCHPLFFKKLSTHNNLIDYDVLMHSEPKSLYRIQLN